MGGVVSDIRFVDGTAVLLETSQHKTQAALLRFAQKTLIRRIWLGYEMELRVRGTVCYKFLIRTETKWDGTAYSLSFDTVSNSWMSVHIPFAALIPVFRAKLKRFCSN